MEKIKKSKSKVIVPLSLVLVGLIVGLIISFGSSVGVKHTSDKNYCASCHTMQPVVDSYKMDIHGGAGEHGIEVKCVYCHLPQDSMANYLITKVKTGMHDLYVENFEDTSKIDWHKMREHRESFTYDSACLNCHTNLKNATESNLKAFNAHRKYFAKTTDKTCVGCHENVGHKDLGLYLPKN
ncbi:cytochrome c3 family protein [Halarcobacter anaerophilus]|jgi:cytochrome c-type protein NapC|uniref:Cytochrome c-type protein n=1 Tax=Halarcobacter anaerophilus TaxID=877500 RepID=A0A4Q0Y4V0_9BACT|nr:NapC/NirT family cytochrome c [Halarcobacter anaerophilus]QDF29639.1 NapC/NirT cytochrome c family protein [Halarcobacter anaerophilus]RXJ64873.1 cytochrome C [Halarcobacter anaerophilus]